MRSRIQRLPVKASRSQMTQGVRLRNCGSSSRLMKQKVVRRAVWMARLPEEVTQEVVAASICVGNLNRWTRSARELNVGARVCRGRRRAFSCRPWLPGLKRAKRVNVRCPPVSSCVRVVGLKCTMKTLARHARSIQSRERQASEDTPGDLVVHANLG